ncbi:MAG: S41 family peptidase [Patescibacteria group bacterium]
MFNNPKFKKTGLVVAAAVLAAAIFSGGYYLGHNPGRLSFFNRPLAFSPEAVKLTVRNTTNTPVDFNLYWQVWDSLKNNYVDKNKVSDQDLFYGSLKGLAESTGDPYTVFMTPQESKEFSDELSGTFEGIGAELGMRNETATVIAPLDGTPAQKAGIRAGDKIYAVNSEPTIGLTIDAIVKKIRGPKDTKVTLTIIRGNDKPKEITITRGIIQVKSVTTTWRPDGLLLIRISNFNNDTAGLFSQAVNLALTKNPKGIIVDLRNNPGGYLDTAVNLASEWVPEGPIVAEQFSGNKRNEYPATGNARLQHFPTVVLINAGSASASEILAGALRDYKKATIVGEKSYGKGSVQTLNDLTGGAALKITVAKWLTPAGDYINDKGLEPNIVVPLSAADADKGKDPQLDKAVQLLLSPKQK